MSRPLMTRRAVVAAAGGLAMAGCGSTEDRVVRLLHIETNADVLTIWRQAADRVCARFPGWAVEFRVLETEAFRSRLPTILQSGNRPHLFYSWGGASVDTLNNAGLLDNIADRVSAEHVAAMVPRAVATYRRHGDLLGLPYLMSEIGILANLRGLDRAGIDPALLGNWSGFLEAVSRAHRAGIVPLAVGGMDRWQLSMIHSHLALRSGGDAGLADALDGRNAGFLAPSMIAAATRFQDLVSTEPFQAGFMSNKAQTALSMFARGGAAMTMHGTWLYRQAAAMVGRSAADLATELPLFPFPRLDGAISHPGAQAQFNGWLVTKNAPQPAIAMLEELTGAETQGRLAGGGFLIPIHRDALGEVANPALAAAAARLVRSPSVQLPWSPLLGQNGGGSAMDAAAGLAVGGMSPQRAMSVIERGWRVEAAASGLDAAAEPVSRLLGVSR